MGNFFFSISKLNYMQPIFLNFEINQVNNPKTFKPLCTRICNYHKHQTSNLIKKYVTKNNTTKNEKKKQLKKNISWIPQCEVAKHHGGSNLIKGVTNRKDGSKTPKLRENLEQENANEESWTRDLSIPFVKKWVDDIILC